MHEDDRKAILDKATQDGLKVKIHRLINQLGAMSSSEHIKLESKNEDLKKFLKLVNQVVKAIDSTSSLLWETV